MQVFTLNCLGTTLRIHIDQSSSCDEDFRCITQKISAFEQKYSRFIPGNWLDLLCKNGSAEVDAETHRMIFFALELARLTHGAFDPTVGSLLSRLGYGRKDEIANTCEIGYQHVELGLDRVILRNDVRLEFGGVGKGYMLHEIAKYLSKYDRYLVDFGGDIYAKWGFDVGLEDPRDITKAIGTIWIEDGFFCASSGAKRRINTDTHHLVDPRSGTSSREVLGAFVSSPDGMVADGFATALCVLGLEESYHLLTSGRIEWAIMASDGVVFRSEGFEGKFFGGGE